MINFVNKLRNHDHKSQKNEKIIKIFTKNRDEYLPLLSLLSTSYCKLFDYCSNYEHSPLPVQIPLNQLKKKDRG